MLTNKPHQHNIQLEMKIDEPYWKLEPDTEYYLLCVVYHLFFQYKLPSACIFVYTPTNIVKKYITIQFSMLEFQ